MRLCLYVQTSEWAESIMVHSRATLTFHHERPAMFHLSVHALPIRKGFLTAKAAWRVEYALDIYHCHLCILLA